MMYLRLIKTCVTSAWGGGGGGGGGGHKEGGEWETPSPPYSMLCSRAR